MKQYKIQCRISKNFNWKDFCDSDNKVFTTTFLDVVRHKIKELRKTFPTMEWKAMFCIIPEWLDINEGELK